MAKKAQEIITRHFDTRQSAWKPLTPATIQQRARQGYGPGPILVRSGTLQRAAASVVTGPEITSTEGSITIEPDASVKPPYGSSSIGDYAAILDAIRPFYEFTESELEEIDQAFSQGFQEAF